MKRMSNAGGKGFECESLIPFCKGDPKCGKSQVWGNLKKMIGHGKHKEGIFIIKDVS